jgi:hypothetical protein
MTVNELTVSRSEYRRRKAARLRSKRAKAVVDPRTGPWTEAEDAIIRRADLYLVEKMAMLQRSENDVRNRVTRIVHGIELVCRYCEQPFMSAASYMANGELRYHQLCSRACQHAERKVLTPIACGYCEKVFQPKQATVRYCSMRCMGDAKSLTKNQITHCKHGHEFTPENTVTYKGSRRICLACRRRRWDEEGMRRRNGRPSKDEELAARLPKWEELGKTWKAVAIMAAEAGIDEKAMKRWLVKCGEQVPDGREARFALIASSTHCKHGHEYTPDNTCIGRTGKRSCRACRRRDVSQSRYRRLAQEGHRTKVEKDADRLAKWAELGKTYEAVTVLAAQSGISTKVLRKWLRERAEFVPGRSEKNYCNNGHELTPENTFTQARNGRNSASRMCRVCRARTYKKFNDKRKIQPGSGDQLRQLVREEVSR